ncbi:UDP-N-acetylmuramate--alanine ligase [Methylohalomonas lacus]|uniref:UDP-N-acetylmuramate--L-alanine ligase n=1 Tax=Methylohalomonas lacus TaxID=398773 RepID=A0AAE3HHB3_9GAMM|nr:UDP-N-acetylmuramate--L-alanine ligase [Methylohalomonas lacus]MCS3902254.1 UDP-N-acetylmuramate--alanine ligase [Methylohalomonas lacus]
MPVGHDHTMGRVRHIHFIGIGGAGMGGIAEVLHNLGYTVSGSDLCANAMTRHLQQLGVNILQGHSPRHIASSDVVVITSAVQPDNPELLAARQERIPVVPRAEMLAELMRFRQGIAIAGTHGKTTTTSLIASVLAEAELDPTYVIGGLLNSSGTHAKLGTGRYFVAEADESDASFLHLQPVQAVLTNIDADHLGTYGGDYANLREHFIEFIHRLPFYGLAVVCNDDPGVRDILPDVGRQVLTYGIDAEADIQGRLLRQEGSRTWFAVRGAGADDWIEYELNLPGKHNVMNALAAVAVATELELDPRAIARGLTQFQGIGRRLQVLGRLDVDGNEVLLIDDYAHHPRELACTIEAVRHGWPGRRLVVIFQPHRYTRTRDLFEDFSRELSEVDVLLMTEVYPAGEAPIAGADSRSLCRAIRLRGQVDPLFIEQRDAIFSLLPGLLADGDIVLLLGAGDISSLAPELKRRYGGETD